MPKLSGREEKKAASATSTAPDRQNCERLATSCAYRHRDFPRDNCADSAAKPRDRRPEQETFYRRGPATKTVRDDSNRDTDHAVNVAAPGGLWRAKPPPQAENEENKLDRNRERRLVLAESPKDKKGF